MALTGIRSKFHPSESVASTLTQWIGCARVIYNAKCDEDRYLRLFAKKYLPVGTWPEIDKTYSQYKTELTPWLKECPSQILRNSATIWHRSYQRFKGGLGGRPKRKSRFSGNYIWLTKELFRIRLEGRMAFIELGTDKNPIGSISARFSRQRVPREQPKSIWIKKTNAGWSIAFSYEDGLQAEQSSTQEHLDYLRTLDRDELVNLITGIDRGVARPAQTSRSGQDPFAPSAKERHKARYREKLLRRYQRKLARQVKSSERRKGTIQRVANLHQKNAQVRENFWHQTTRQIVNESKVVVIEDLKLKNMTRRPKAKVSSITGKWEKNGASAKSGLNRSILGVGLGQFEQFLSYKMAMANKPLFKVAPHHTSQECACCGHTHPSNRQTQSLFVCKQCGNTNNADVNASLVIAKRAVDLILNSGTELTGTHKNVLRLRTDANSHKTQTAKAVRATSCLSKKKAA